MLNSNFNLIFFTCSFVCILYLVFSWSYLFVITICSTNIVAIQSIFLNDECDGCSIFILAVIVIAGGELLYSHLTGHHSYLFTKLIYNPNDPYWKSGSSGSSGTFYSYFEEDIMYIVGFIFLLIVFVVIGYLFSTQFIRIFRKSKLSLLKDNNFLIFIILICPVLFFTSISYFFPFCGLIIMTFTMLLLLPIGFPFKINESFAAFRSNLIDNLLLFLYNIKVVAFASTLSIIVFCQPIKTFRNYLILGAICCVSYALISRWYFFETIVMHHTITGLTSINVYILMFLGLFFVYLRIIISLSFIIMNTTFLKRPDLLPNSVVYVLTGDENPFGDQPTPAQYPRQNPPRPISFINIDRSRHYYRMYMENMPHNGKIFRYVGIGVGTAGVGAAAYAAYHTGLQTDAAVRSANAAERAADASCVQAGVMTKEEFHSKWNSSFENFIDIF